MHWRKVAISPVRAYIDNVAVITVINAPGKKSEQLNRSITVVPGRHHLVVLGYQSTGGQVANSINFTVSGTGQCDQGTVRCEEFETDEDVAG